MEPQSFNGLLINAIVEPITHDLTVSYTVPNGKNLYISHLFTTTSYTYIDGIAVKYGYSNSATDENGLSNHLMLKSGQVLTVSTGLVGMEPQSFNGYLADENYFAGCGGGSSSSASNATIDSLSQVVASLDSIITLWSSIFPFGCTDPNANNYNSLATLDDGSCVFCGCTDPTALNYDSTASCNDGSCAYAIGDTYQGGIIFYLDGNGGGLIAAPSDIASAEWGCINTWISGPNSTGVGTGLQNTESILNYCPTSNIAAEYCAYNTLGGYTDWFLPSKDELNLMYLNIGQGNALGLANIGVFNNSFYWSSTQIISHDAWGQNFSNGSQYGNDKDVHNYVRAIRAF